MSDQTQGPARQFQQECAERIADYAQDHAWHELSRAWMQRAFEQKYMYNFSWMGRPVIQTPIDLLAMQELIWRVKPQVIVETGVAHGGSLVFYASMLELLGEGEVIGIDIDIRSHNRAAIEAHPMAKRIQLIQGSSIDAPVVEAVRERVAGKQRVMVCLDSMHTEAHVLAELEAYAPMVTPGSYLVVFDTIVEDLPPGFFSDRPWNVGDNPKTALQRWLPSHPEFQVDEAFENKLMLTVSPSGFLRRK
ncbi:MAG: cephalosporin hydroxylase family protein [Gammaproteobacteria bacterium]|nr:cephalosporin hydroxylase family protein [Gammaproteobacteria bacterium]